MKTQRLMQAMLNSLPAFEAAARAGSFTKAAESLGMAQPSVSRFIANLESHVGVKLFERRHNQIELTSAGVKLYEATSLGLGHIKSVIEELDQTQGGNALTIGCTHGFAHMWILPRIEFLHGHLPGKEIRMTTMDHVANFSTADVDFVIRFGDGNWEDGEAFLLFEEEVFPVCSPAFAARHQLLRQNAAPNELARLPLLFQDMGEHGWLSWEQWLAHHNVQFVPPKSAFMIYNYAFILQAAMEGKGLALAWGNLVEPHFANRWLVELEGFRVRTGNGYYLVVSQGHPEKETAKMWAETVN